jgi:hypothetical protein
MSALLLMYEIAENEKINGSHNYDTSNCFTLENKKMLIILLALLITALLQGEF